jgi:hypothetical protein
LFLGARYFAGLFGGNTDMVRMADWRDADTDEYPDFQVSNVFNYGGITSAAAYQVLGVNPSGMSILTVSPVCTMT